MQGSISKKPKAEARCKRRDDIFKRKKRSMQVLYTEQEIAEIFAVQQQGLAPLKLLPSPETFLSQMHNTFQRKFPSYMPSAEVLRAITGAG